MLGHVTKLGAWLLCLYHGWKEIGADDPQLGAALHVEKDILLAPETTNKYDWKTWVIVENDNPDPVNIAFRTREGTKYHRSIILPKEYIALRVGPYDVDFMFRYTERMPRMASAPRLVERVDDEVLEAKYSRIRRF